MKCRFKIQILFLLLVLLVNTYSKADPGLKVIPGGQPFDRGNTKFIEDAILKFDTLQLSKSRLKRLEDAYRTWKSEDPSRKNIRMAGFCFVPILEKPSEATNPVHFFTIGYRIAVALWIPGPVPRDRAERVTVDSIGFLGFNNYMDVFNSAIGSAQYVDAIYFKASENTYNPPTIFSPLSHADSVIMKTREFDLVFLDSVMYKYLVENNDYFSPDDGVSDSERGILVTRVVNTTVLKDNSLNDTTDHYLRSLMFRPLPLPQLQNFASAASITYVYGGNCPPYWYLNEQSGVVDKGYERIIQLVQNSPVTLNPGLKSIWDEQWLRILLIILAILGLIFGLFLGIRPIREAISGLLGWRVTTLKG